MPIYRYRAKATPEKIVEGRIEANSEEEAIEQVSKIGYLPIRVSEEKTEAKPRRISAPVFLGRVRSRDITIFSRQLASFLKSGMPILRALNIISEQSENPYLRDMFGNIRAEVRDGKPLSLALAAYPQVFSLLYVAMVSAGEESGTLSTVFLRLAAHRRRQEEFISQVRIALVYPLLMSLVAVATIVFMFTFVMPRLTRIFSTLGEELPRITKILIAVSNGLRSSWHWILVVIALGFFILRRSGKTKAAAITFSRLKLSLPVYGNFIRQVELARFSRTLELLLKNGLPVLKAIAVAIPTLDNELLKEQLRQSYKELERGASFGKSLKKSALFPAFMTNLLIVGEEAGRLEEALAEIADGYERESEETIKVMTTLLEPTIILAMGTIVGFIVMAMLLPVFQINLMVR